MTNKDKGKIDSVLFSIIKKNPNTTIDQLEAKTNYQAQEIIVSINRLKAKKHIYSFKDQNGVETYSLLLHLDKRVCRDPNRYKVDYDYIDDLLEQLESPIFGRRNEAKEGLDFLAQFNKEYYNSEGLKEEDALHTTPGMRKDCYSNSNAARRDVSYFLDWMEECRPEEVNEFLEDLQKQTDSPENAINHWIDKNIEAEYKPRVRTQINKYKTATKDFNNGKD